MQCLMGLGQGKGAEKGYPESVLTTALTLEQSRWATVGADEDK